MCIVHCAVLNSFYFILGEQTAGNKTGMFFPSFLVFFIIIFISYPMIFLLFAYHILSYLIIFLSYLISYFLILSYYVLILSYYFLILSYNFLTLSNYFLILSINLLSGMVVEPLFQTWVTWCWPRGWCVAVTSASQPSPAAGMPPGVCNRDKTQKI